MPLEQMGFALGKSTAMERGSVAKPRCLSQGRSPQGRRRPAVHCVLCNSRELDTMQVPICKTLVTYFVLPPAKGCSVA